MHEETPNIPEFDVMFALQQRLAQKTANGNVTQSSTSQSTFDPYKLMVQRKAVESGNAPLEPIQNWPNADIQKLEEFCKQMGIIGFNCGRMSPLAALAMLKQKLGVVDEPTSESRIPYTVARQKILLKG